MEPQSHTSPEAPVSKGEVPNGDLLSLAMQMNEVHIRSAQETPEKTQIDRDRDYKGNPRATFTTEIDESTVLSTRQDHNGETHTLTVKDEEGNEVDTRLHIRPDRKAMIFDNDQNLVTDPTEIKKLSDRFGVSVDVQDTLLETLEKTPPHIEATTDSKVHDLTKEEFEAMMGETPDADDKV